MITPTPEMLGLTLVMVIPAMLVHRIWTWWRNRPRHLYRLAHRKGIAAIKQMSWQDFERLCGQYFKQKGYKVEMCGLGGADGGMDLLLRKRGKVTLVQCKHWKARVGVTTVREMYGIMHAQDMDAVIIVALSGFTREAKLWAEGKPISLMGGRDLLN